MIKISFIIPVYNCSPFLMQWENFIKLAEIKQYEVIFVDDGSTDDSAQICEKLSNLYDVVKFIRQKNQGVSAARNKGLSVAEGDYVIFFDADDTIDLENLFDLIKKVEENPSIDMVVFGHSFDYYKNEKLYRRDEMKAPLVGIKKSEIWLDKLSKLYYTNSLSPIWNKVFRRSVLLDNELNLRTDMFIYEDLDFSVRCMAFCDKILFEPDIIYRYRQSENAKKRLEQVKYISVVLNQIEKSFNKLIEKKGRDKQKSEIQDILLSLYLVLAREKIAVSDLKTIYTICDDFIDWYNKRDFHIKKGQVSFINALLGRKILNIFIKRNYSLVRHKIAVIVKSIFFGQ